jgi:hypothetical protein
MVLGPAAGLELVDALVSEGSLEGYHLLPSVRGDLLGKLDRFEEARDEFERAASLTRNERERALLLERAAECGRDRAGAGYPPAQLSPRASSRVRQRADSARHDQTKGV